MISGKIHSNHAHIPSVELIEDQYISGPIRVDTVRVGCVGNWVIIPKVLLPEVIKVLETYVYPNE